MDTLLPGTEVVARGLRWEVVFVQPAGAHSICRLRCLEGGAQLQGREHDLLVPFERVTPVAAALTPEHPGRVQDWRVYHDAFLLEQALGPDALLAAQPGRLRVAPYQLVPVLRALALPRPRLLLADDVGLGKTIQAGLVLAELIARRRAHRVLVVSPAGPLLQQWQGEMRERFGLRFRVLDADALKEIRYAQELGANPFDHEALGLISIDFAKQERILQDLERAQFDLVVIDEAHHCVRAAGDADREDSQRRRLAEVLARRSDGLLLLTATPHDGHDAHFASLVELLDPSLVNGRGELRGNAWERHVVRRLKRHIRDQDGAALFRARVVHPHPVACDADATPAFAAFQVALMSLVVPLLRRAMKRRQYGEVLAFVSLLKRSVSTALACAATLDVVAARLDDVALGRSEAPEARTQRLRTLRELNRRAARFGTLSAEEQQDQSQIEAEELAATLLDTPPEDRDALLAGMAEALGRMRRADRRAATTRDALRLLAQMAREAHGEDPKLRALVEAIVAVRRDEPSANVLVYTEYADSLHAARGAVEAALRKGSLSGALLTLSGEDPDAARAAITDRFTREDNLVLLSTDASAEGLNLHARCHHLLHLELPYNPNRLEQRNGRIDRFGQTHDPQVRYLYLAASFEERLLFRLAERYEAQRKRLGFVPNTFGATFVGAEDARGESLVAGLADAAQRRIDDTVRPLDAAAFAAQDDATPAFRDMLDEIDAVLQSAERVARSHGWLGDAGLHAETRLAADADRARTEGQRLGAIDLVRFVVEAVRTDSTAARPAVETAPGRWALTLPPAWQADLHDLPGWDASAGVLRLSTRVDDTRDDDGRPLGYIGRAHPIVRKALDRVRHIQLGADDVHVDRRVAVVGYHHPTPAVIFTFLGRVQSGAGRAYERVLAVQHPRGGAPHRLDALDDWLGVAVPDRALPPRGVWSAHFAAWAPDAARAAEATARAHFADLVAAWQPQHLGRVDEEAAALRAWMVARADELCGPAERQPGLFAPAAGASWRTLTDPVERLAAFAVDSTVPAARRGDARTALALHARRREALDQRARLEAPAVTPLGMLLCVPEGGTRGA